MFPDFRTFYYEHILFSMLHEMIQYRHCHKGCLEIVILFAAQNSRYTPTTCLSFSVLFELFREDKSIF